MYQYQVNQYSASAPVVVAASLPIHTPQAEAPMSTGAPIAFPQCGGAPSFSSPPQYAPQSESASNPSQNSQQYAATLAQFHQMHSIAPGHPASAQISSVSMAGEVQTAHATGGTPQQGTNRSQNMENLRTAVKVAGVASRILRIAGIPLPF